MFPANFGYVAARSVDEALKLLAKHGEEGKLLAGGHSLIPAMKLRLASPRTLIDLSRVPELNGVRLDGNTLVIGALTVHADVASSEPVRQHLPGLADAASVIGDLQVRNRGTIGGSVAHADPAADLPVILTALNASFVVRSAAGSRTVAADDFFTDFYTTAMAGNEILTEVRVPLPPAGSGTAYLKLPHPASGYAVVSAGVLITRQAQRIVPVPFAEILDPRTGRARVRGVDTSSDHYRNALALQERVAAEDLADAGRLAAIAKAAGLSPEEARRRYAPL